MVRYEMSTKLPEELQRYLDEKDWKNYTRLCSRYNIEPTEYFKQLPNCKMVTSDLLVLDMDELTNFQFFDDITLFNIIELRVVGNRDTKPFILSSLNNYHLPNLIRLSVQNPLGQIECLDYLNIPSLTSLSLKTRVRNIRRLEMGNLLNLSIRENSLWDMSLDFLNNSEMESLNKLSVFGSSTENNMRLDNIDWARYPLLQSLIISRLSLNRYHFVTIDSRLEDLKQLNSLQLLSGTLNVQGKVRLDGLTHASLILRNIGDLQGLTLPNIKYLYVKILFPNIDYQHKLVSQIQEIIGNDQVKIRQLPT